MNRFAILTFEMVIVVVSVYAADLLQAHIAFIPKWLIHLPSVSYSVDEFYTVLKYFFIIYLMLILVCQMLIKSWNISNAKRTIDEIFIFAAGFSISSLIIFTTTNVSFDPQFMVGIVVCSTVLIVLSYLMASMNDGLTQSIKQIALSLVRRIISIPGMLVLILAISPGILAKLFVSDRDVANMITKIRIMMTMSENHPWGFVNIFPNIQFTQPIALQFAPNNNNTIYILQRNGQLFSVPWKGDGEKKILLDIRDKLGYVEVENGALGFDFHPKFGSENSYVYIYYTSVHEDTQKNYLSRFDLSYATMQQRNLNEQNLITWERNNSGFHNGGSVEFGPDKFLYIGIGEMTELESHQRLDRTMTGGVFRIDVDKKGGDISHPIIKKPDNGTTDNYFIPNDNPLANKNSMFEEYWAWGFRNPFRMSFDSDNGDLWVGDVGSTIWEEVNIAYKGKNYQFPFIEGRENTDIDKSSSIIGDEQEPVYTYRHTAYDRAVIGGIVYRGMKYPSINGMYIFGDNYSGNIFSLPADQKRVNKVETIAKAPQYAQYGLTSFLETPDGEILITTMGKPSIATGLILKLVPHGEADNTMLFPIHGSMKISEDEATSIYSTNCSRCHGKKGRGDGPDAPYLGIPMPDFKLHKYHISKTDDHLREVIYKGGVGTGMSPLMPPWETVLSEKEIDAMVIYIRDFDEGHSH
ncbi:MAG: c-type cytochrome [Gammaproteobacteria bacterium]|nr:c-type cytochrome [Gammaproteobacteria bacterium]